MSDRSNYAEVRADFLTRFERSVRDENSVVVHDAPSGRFRLEISQYDQPDTRWSYSRGVVTEIATGRLIADIKRNFGHFWHAWVRKIDGREWLLCGEDYQGYSVIDLDAAATAVVFEDAGLHGHGFCWVEVRPSADGEVLAVHGCYWACPCDLVFFDFSDPSVLPLPEIFRVPGETDTLGWVGNDEFHYRVETPAYEDDPEPPMVAAIWTRAGHAPA